MMRNLLYCFFLCWGLPFLIRAGNPVITNYTRADYGAGNKNWSVGEDERGMMYFGNDAGLLEFDGVEWRLNKHPKAEVVRSVLAASHRKIYTGGYEEFGYWERGADDRLTYVSLSVRLPAGTLRNDDIWRIAACGGRVYFQSFGGIFFYCEQTGEVAKIPSDRNFHFLMQAGGELWVQELYGALFRVEGDRLSEIPGSGLFASTEVKAVLPFGEHYLIVTSQRGLYVYDGTAFSLWNSDERLTGSEINCAVRSRDGAYCIGTLLDGIYMLDAAGRIVDHLYADLYIRNNTVLSLFEDSRGMLWAALDQGIACIRRLPGLDCYTDPSGKTGSVYAAALYGGKLFIGTNQGLFYTEPGDSGDIRFVPHELRMIPAVKGQVWCLKVIDDRLYCGFNTGLRVIDSLLNVRDPYPIGAGVFSVLKSGPYLLAATYTSLKIVDTRTAERVLDAIPEPLTNVQIDHLNNIWLEHMNKGVYRCRLSDDMRRMVSTEYYGENCGLPYKLRLFKIGGRIVLLGGNAFYTYDDIEGKIKPYEPLRTCLGELAEIRNVSGIDKNRFWAVGDNVLYRVVNDGSRNRIEEKYDVGGYGMSLVPRFEKIVRLTDTTDLVCLDNGFLICPSRGRRTAAPVLRSPYIRSLTARRGDGSVLVSSDSTRFNVPASCDAVTIGFASPDVLSHPVSFQYKLGGAGEWSEPQKVNRVVYERLPAGEYAFLLRTIDNLGNVSETAERRFRILAPWYRTAWAYGGCLLLFLLAVQLARRQALRRYRKKHWLKVRLREAKRLSRMNARLQDRIREKDAELLSQTSFIIQRNELILKMKEEIEDFYRKHDSKALAPLFFKINKLFNTNLDAEEDWKMFLIKFEEKHAGFFKQLKTAYPQLTANDLKLCACLKLNLDSKSIAALMNVSVRSVENGRYRLRKKIGIAPSENLNDFFLKF